KRIDIAPGERDYRIADSFELPCAVEAITVGGHAHLLCKSMKLWANAPDGSEIPLLEIREWDFDWQDRYVYAEPVALPRGARIHAEIVYDNSADNPNNPHRPPARVRWGRETTDEMGSLTLMVVPADEGDLATLRTATAEKNREALHFGRLPRLRRAVEALGGRGR
ncbi:MAG: hypothetical protein KDE27_31230, partial [Planctomycetes bacterium]|nr:hypothetical protein [Planctomycetota bacterium]